ncbi:MAG: lysozyme inhibitor LprI family protein [Hyphomicrobiaceae bacterium]|nr:lysozyme inhibitor LprI family protein [Hyphomicrobiaceae bacterium]
MTLKHMKRAICGCLRFSRAVSLVMVVLFVAWQNPAAGADPDTTNAIISTCVDGERASGRDGRACIGRVTGPCKAKSDNAYREDQMECDEREFVLWSQLVQKEYGLLKKLLTAEQREALQNSQSLWVRYQSDDCRLPYAFFAKDMADFAGPACTIKLKASRVLQLRAWRDALGKL